MAQPVMNWRTPPFAPRARTLTRGGKKYTVRPEGPGSNRYVLFVDDARTQIYGSGMHYVMVIVEDQIRKGKI